jgi:hypothetical protein
MSKRRKKNKLSAAPPPVAEEQSTEIVTVCWTLSVVMALVFDLGAALARLYVRQNPENEMAAMFSGLVFFSAAVVGVVSLALLPIVLKLRREPPPRGFVMFAIAVGVAPLGMALAQWLS